MKAGRCASFLSRNECLNNPSINDVLRDTIELQRASTQRGNARCYITDMLQR